MSWTPLTERRPGYSQPACNAALLHGGYTWRALSPKSNTQRERWSRCPLPRRTHSALAFVHVPNYCGFSTHEAMAHVTVVLVLCIDSKHEPACRVSVSRTAVNYIRPKRFILMRSVLAKTMRTFSSISFHVSLVYAYYNSSKTNRPTGNIITVCFTKVLRFWKYPFITPTATVVYLTLHTI